MTLALLWLLACGTSSEPEVPEVAEAREGPEAPEADPSTELKAHMQGHLRDIDAVREALVRGDLIAAKRANRSFLDHKVAFDLPGDWIAHVSTMGDAAVKLDKATDLAGAAGHAADVAAACGGCHREVGAVIELAAPTPVPGEVHGPKERHELQTRWYAMVAQQADAEAPDAAEAAAELVACATCHAKVPKAPAESP